MDLGQWEAECLCLAWSGVGGWVGVEDQYLHSWFSARLIFLHFRPPMRFCQLHSRVLLLDLSSPSSLAAKRRRIFSEISQKLSFCSCLMTRRATPTQLFRSSVLCKVQWTCGKYECVCLLVVVPIADVDTGGSPLVEHFGETGVKSGNKVRKLQLTKP